MRKLDTLIDYLEHCGGEEILIFTLASTTGIVEDPTSASKFADQTKEKYPELKVVKRVHKVYLSLPVPVGVCS